jgi:hypothetical protein
LFARSPSLARRVFSIAGAPFLALLGLLACGRSTLDDYLIGDGGSPVPDGGADVADVQAPDDVVCNATTCPTGCCAPDGSCAPGSAPTACGTLGEACQSCPAEGFGLCDPTRHACGNPVASCSAATCGGCCEGNVCFAGTDPNECGQSGESCLHCQSAGLACIGEQCLSTGCGPGNCAGCCFGEECVAGSDPTACGEGGQVCSNCLARGENCVSEGGPGGLCEVAASCGAGNCQGCCQGNTCFPGVDAIRCGVGAQACQDCSAMGALCVPAAVGADVGGQCIGTPPPPVCNGQTCPSGCCDGANCLPGNLDSFCGIAGAACLDCEAQDQRCQGQSCSDVPPPCNATNCQGCCDTFDVCQPGFIDVQCGQAGKSCEDCTQLVPASTCDTGVSPRTCESQQTQCPGPYPSCPSGLETPSPGRQSVCSSTELENAGAACAAGAHSAVCNAFFTVEQADDPGCAACLGAFDFDFAELTGLATCVAPFADVACNHTTACVVDCTQEACAQCGDAAALAQCRSQVPGGVCAAYYEGAQCVANAFMGAGNFCAPAPGAGGFGNWLATVGQFYCGSLERLQP